MASPTTSAPLTSGRIVLQRYRLEERIGEGGMGTVFVARHIHLDTRVAVKVLHPAMGIDHRTREARFLREAQIVATLRHPNVIRLIDYGFIDELDRTPCIVMELLDGPSFDEVLVEQGAQPFEVALEVCIAAASALSAAHANAVIHRDVKPANLVRASDGIRLVDFGVALPAVDELRLSNVGEILGTPLYLAPELLLGAEASCASDLYALGVTLYEIVCGRPPFIGPDLRALVTSIQSGAPPLRVPAGLPALPGTFRQLVAKLLSLAPDRRPPSAAHVLAYALAIRSDARKPKVERSSAWEAFASISEPESRRLDTQPEFPAVTDVPPPSQRFCWEPEQAPAAPEVHQGPPRFPRPLRRRSASSR